MNIAIVGAGWAGLAAASDSLARGFSVTMFDAAHTAGGRARAVYDPSLGELDNGQHLMIGGYRQTLRLMQKDMGDAVVASNLLRLPLWLRSADHTFELRARSGNASALTKAWTTAWTSAFALARAKGLNLHDKWQIARFLQRLGKNHDEPDAQATPSVAQWLTAEKQTKNACRWLWYPLCLATLNTAPEQACAKLFSKVIKDSLLSKDPGATDLLIPRTTLSELWPRAVAARVNMRWGHTVRQILADHNRVYVDGQPFDACVVATPPASTRRLLSPLPELASVCAQLNQFDYRAIATCYVGLDRHDPLPAPLMLFDHAESDNTKLAQWVFDRTQIMHTAPAAQLAFIVSDAGNLPEQSDTELAQSMVHQLSKAQGKKDIPSVIGARCFVEKRATFAALPGLERPHNETPVRGLLIAGDWTDTGYPAVIEGAVQSGLAAIAALTKQNHPA